MLTSDTWATSHATNLKTDFPKFHVSLFGGAKPQTSEAVAGDFHAPGPLLTYKNLLPTNTNDYPITWAAPVALSRTLVRDQTIVAIGTGTVLAGNGTYATWAMIHASDDDLTAGTDKFRAVMSVGTNATEIIMSNPLCKQGISKTLDFEFSIVYTDPT